MKQRAQAALEFMTSYGWAILSLLVVLGALAYMGIFSAGNNTPETCIFNSEFSCDNHQHFFDVGEDRLFALVLLRYNTDATATFNATATMPDKGINATDCFITTIDPSDTDARMGISLKLLPEEYLRVYCYYDGIVALEGEPFNSLIILTVKPDRKFSYTASGELRSRMIFGIAPTGYP